ncbi:hypothetical protein B296_00040755 [Ensete ventricosum]|uniref:Uncharacterized protein n=1 Tax=Ensete ventricosum TaxID=4639 RepID=A0A426YMC7_ENSVE|nr:hypothetical protein B296_00040755 [Ensete ventricosum]
MGEKAPATREQRRRMGTGDPQAKTTRPILSSTYRSDNLPIHGPVATGRYYQKAPVGSRLREKSTISSRLRSNREGKKKNKRKRRKKKKLKRKCILSRPHPCVVAILAPSPLADRLRAVTAIIARYWHRTKLYSNFKARKEAGNRDVENKLNSISRGRSSSVTRWAQSIRGALITWQPFCYVAQKCREQYNDYLLYTVIYASNTLSSRR